MNLRKTLLWIAAIVAVVMGALMLLTPQEVTVQREAEIAVPVEYAFEQVNDLKNWTNWMPWLSMDPEMDISYGDITAGPGGWYSWEGKKAGAGKLTITGSKPNEAISTNIYFDGQGESTGNWTFTPQGDKTLVSWAMTTDAGYNPLGRAFNLLMDFMVGPDFEKGLANLTEVAIANFLQASEAQNQDLAAETQPASLAEQE